MSNVIKDSQDGSIGAPLFTLVHIYISFFGLRLHRLFAGRGHGHQQVEVKDVVTHATTPETFSSGLLLEQSSRSLAKGADDAERD